MPSNPQVTQFDDLPGVKTYLLIAQGYTLEDARLTRWISQVSALIEKYLGRTIAQHSYTEFYDGQGTENLIVNQYPIVSVQNLWYNQGGFWGDPNLVNPNSVFQTPQDLLVQGTDYALRRDQPDGSSASGIIYKINDVWTKFIQRSPGLLSPTLQIGYGNINLQYTAGYNQIPADLTLALDIVIAYLRSWAQYGRPLSSESYEERAVSYEKLHGPFGILNPVISILAKYKRNALGASPG
jgi:hypothetical protein